VTNAAMDHTSRSEQSKAYPVTNKGRTLGLADGTRTRCSGGGRCGRQHRLLANPFVGKLALRTMQLQATDSNGTTVLEVSNLQEGELQRTGC
jgi:hypothetical protein